MNLNFSIFEKFKEIKLDSIFGNFFSFISRIILLIFLLLVVLILLFVIPPIMLRIYFNQYPITDKEYDALAKFVLYSCTIITMIYYCYYLIKRIRFKHEKLKQTAIFRDTLHKKRMVKLQKDIEMIEKMRVGEESTELENNDNNDSNDSNNNNYNNEMNENKNETRIVEINNYILPDEEVCKKVIIDYVNKTIKPENPKEMNYFYEQKRLEFLNHIMKKFDYDYKKAYFHIFIKNEFEE